MRSPTGTAAVLWLACAAVLPAGCGSNYPQTVPVSGRVTMDGGAMPGPGRLYFTPAEPAQGFPRHPGTASFESDGHFTVTTFESADGLMPGRYLVAVECWEVAPAMGGQAPKSYLSPKYQAAKSSGWEVVIEPGSSRRFVEFDVSTQ